MRQGELYEHTIGTTRYRVLVVSSDAHNSTGKTPWIMPIRRGNADAPPYLVALADADPIGGTADVDRLARVTPTGDAIGIITGATMHRIREAVNTLFAG